jgi:hypothetical protein
MYGDIFVYQATNHLLIFQTMFFGLSFKKIHTSFGQRQSLKRGSGHAKYPII